MNGGSGGEGDRDTVTDPGLLASLQSVRDVYRRPVYAFNNGELLENVRALHTLIAAADAAKLSLLAELDHRPDVVPGAFRGNAGMVFLTEGLHESRAQASRDVAAAEATGSAHAELPQLGQALADGEIFRAHLDEGCQFRGTGAV
jgi:hypothetical protein